MLSMRKGRPLPLGVSKNAEGVGFAVAMPGVGECALRLYRKEGCAETEGLPKEMSFRMEDKEGYKIGDVFCCTIVGQGVESVLTEQYEYVYEAGGREVLDPYASEVCGRSQWGKARGDGRGTRCGVTLAPYPWEDEERPGLSYSDMVLYQIHVRGYTKSRSSRVAGKGTFLGVVEKIPHLLELGVNALLLAPCYEFDEVMREKGSQRVAGESEDARINYWGYTEDAFYFAPKAAYAASGSRPSTECKEMVKNLHRNGVEVLLEVKFPGDANGGFVLDCLRHWVLEYHVDGFLVNQEVVPESLVRTDPVLADVKLLGEQWSNGGGPFAKRRDGKKRLANFNVGFMTDARRYVKSDEGVVHAFAMRMKSNSAKVGVVNYITQINGFTLMDMVSYDVKHNEANGEAGRDGTDLNYSWNCGVEGKTRKNAILEKRLKQMKNAAMMLMFSQGTPMILGGDEFGNSQNGNNNAYCQDNEVGWVNWNATKMGREFHEFLKELIAFRKSHPIFHMEEELLGMDAIGCGFPDISFHGTSAWYTDFTYYSRVLGVMLCGAYAAKGSDGRKPQEALVDEYFYVIFNMHWEEHAFDLPMLPVGLSWEVAMSSYGGEVVEEGRTIKVDQRTVVLLKSVGRRTNKGRNGGRRRKS